MAPCLGPRASPTFLIGTPSYTLSSLNLILSVASILKDTTREPSNSTTVLERDNLVLHPEDSAPPPSPHFASSYNRR